MVTKKMFATMIGTAMICAGVATAFAFGSMNGDCTMSQLQDGSCGECPNDECPNTTLSIFVESGNMNGDCLMDQLRDGTGDNCTDICE